MMRFAKFLSLAAVALPALAGPIKYTRDADATSLLVLTFAHVLEQLETEFYTKALSTFKESDFTSAGFSSAQLAIQQVTAIQQDESSHLSFLAKGISALGGTPLQCSFNFGSALSSVTVMAQTARVVENVGVSAYLGGAAILTDPRIVAEAGSILTDEARHQTVLNIMSSTGSAIPSAFDIPLNPSEILAIAGPFISGCSLPIPANPTLTITNTGTPAIGTALTFSWQGMPSDTSSLFCQMMVGGSVIAVVLPMNECVVPSGINGPVAIFVTKDNNPLANNVVDRTNTTLCAGPTMAFIDSNSQEVLGSLVRPSVSGGASSSSSTTVSPAEASAIASSGSSESSSGSSSGSGPNLSTGPNGDGSINVVGWANLPSSASSPSGESSSSSSSSSPSGY